MNSQRQFLLQEIDNEFNNIDYCWYQGQTAFKEAQKSAKKIFTLLKIQHGSSFSTKNIVEKMMNKLGHLNGISNWKIRNLLRDDLIE